MRTENDKIKIAVLTTVSKLIDVIGDRFVVLTNDLLSFLSETLDDVNSEVKNKKFLI